MYSTSSKEHTRNNPDDATDKNGEDRAEAVRLGYRVGLNAVASTRPRSWGVSMVSYH